MRRYTAIALHIYSIITESRSHIFMHHFFIYTNIHRRVYIYICPNRNLRASVHVHIYVYVCVDVFIYEYAYTQRTRRNAPVRPGVYSAKHARIATQRAAQSPQPRPPWRRPTPKVEGAWEGGVRAWRPPSSARGAPQAAPRGPSPSCLGEGRRQPRPSLLGVLSSAVALGAWGAGWPWR